ncbi:hypothetical protein DL98DRAFT_651103 [Cadophora sp. DSE1049]|nr:hypothetical protein DL98DRAFT_651103 [Cadophora sp. DSE1049]
MAHTEAPPISRKVHGMTDQVVLLTGIGCVGSGWGNGLSTATLFATQGAVIFGCDFNISAAETTKSQILAENSKTDIIVMKADCTSSPSIRNFCGRLLNTLVPGLINTPLMEMLADKYAGGDYEGYCNVPDAQVPTGKMSSAWDVANAVLFLASKEASYITGTEIVVALRRVPAERRN